jgi:hypothetical protein
MSPISLGAAVLEYILLRFRIVILACLLAGTLGAGGSTGLGQSSHVGRPLQCGSGRHFLGGEGKKSFCAGVKEKKRFLYRAAEMSDYCQRPVLE